MKRKNFFNYFSLSALLLFSSLSFAVSLEKQVENATILNTAIKAAEKQLSSEYRFTHEYLSHTGHDSEAKFEALALWGEKFGPKNQDFLRSRGINPEKAFTISMGTSSTQWSYRNDDHSIFFGGNLFGTDDFLCPTAEKDLIIEEQFFKEIGYLFQKFEKNTISKEIVIFNAIGHTVDKESEHLFWVINNETDFGEIKAIFAATQRGDKSEGATVSKAFAVKLANFLYQLVSNTGSKITLLSNKDESQGICNPWTIFFNESVVLDIGGGSMSAKVDGETLEDCKDRSPDANANTIIMMDATAEEVRAASERYAGCIIKMVQRIAKTHPDTKIIARQTGKIRELMAHIAQNLLKSAGGAFK